jgi:hypothetical protein
MTYWDEKNKELILLSGAVALCLIVLTSMLMLSTTHRKVYTVEVYQIFDVTYKTRRRDGQNFTCVYTRGQGQFFFRGTHDINLTKSYVFTYKETGKRWRDLELLEYREFNMLRREP